jgi:hypothetical protein
MMRNLLSLLATMVVSLPLFFFNVNASPPDSCLMELPYMYLGLSKPDSSTLFPTLYIDTCGIRSTWAEQKTIHGGKVLYENFDTAYYYFKKGKIETQMGDNWDAQDNFYGILENTKRLYATGVYSFTFSVPSPFDTTGKNLNEMNYFEVTDISNQYTTLRNEFVKMEEKYGKIKFYLNKDNVSLKISQLYKYTNREPHFRTYVVFDNPINAFQFDVENNIDGCILGFRSGFDHTVGIKGNNDFNQILLYPNPVHSNLNITQLEYIQSITIYDIIGTKVYSSPTDFRNSLVIDCSTLKNGMYFIKFDDKITKSFIIRR